MSTTTPPIGERQKLFSNGWQTFAPETAFAGLTLTQFLEKLQSGESLRSQIGKMQQEIDGLKQQLRMADAEAKETLVLIAHAVRGNPAHGENSALYRSLGFVPKSERKTGRRGSASAKNTSTTETKRTLLEPSLQSNSSNARRSPTQITKPPVPLQGLAVFFVKNSVIQFFRITATDGKTYDTEQQDRLFESVFDRMLNKLPQETDKP